MSAKKSRNELRSTFVTVARRLGLLSAQRARDADNAVESRPDDASQDILVEEGYLSPEDACTVEAARRKVDVAEHLDDQFRRALHAVGDAKNAAERLFDASRPRRKNSA